MVWPARACARITLAEKPVRDHGRQGPARQQNIDKGQEF
jgi:hypothetical protein